MERASAINLIAIVILATMERTVKKRIVLEIAQEMVHVRMVSAYVKEDIQVLIVV